MLTRHSRMWFLVSVRNTYRNLLYFVTLFENKGVKKCENISIISSKTKSLERYVISQNYLKKNDRDNSDSDEVSCDPDGRLRIPEVR